MEAARVLAQRLLAENSSDAERIEQAFRLATSRHPNKEELSILSDRLQQLRQIYEAAPDEAKAICSAGEFARDDTVDPVNHAALTGICLALFNLDEALNK